jgi:hypothetical protein
VHNENNASALKPEGSATYTLKAGQKKNSLSEHINMGSCFENLDVNNTSTKRIMIWTLGSRDISFSCSNLQKKEKNIGALSLRVNNRSMVSGSVARFVSPVGVELLTMCHLSHGWM